MSLRGTKQSRRAFTLCCLPVVAKIYYFSVMKRHEYAVYIMTNKANTAFYVGVTSDLQGRVYDHKNETYKGFTATYKCHKLVYYEEYQWIQDAIARENS